MLRARRAPFPPDTRPRAQRSAESAVLCACRSMSRASRKRTQNLDRAADADKSMLEGACGCLPSVQLSLCDRTPTHSHALHVHAHKPAHTHMRSHARRNKHSHTTRACARALHHALLNMLTRVGWLPALLVWHVRVLGLGVLRTQQAYAVVR